MKSKSKVSELSKKDRILIKSALDFIYNNDCTLLTLKKHSNLKKHFYSLYSFKLIHVTEIEQRILLTEAGVDLLCYLNSLLI